MPPDDPSSPLPFAGMTPNSLLKLLLRSPSALSIQQIATGLNVTKTAARQHIQNLERNAYVKKSTVSKGRGRPTFAYQLSAAGRELFTRQYALFSEKMIANLKDALGPVAVKKQMRALGKGLADDLKHKMPSGEGPATTDQEALSQLAEIMRELGYDTQEVENNEIIAHNCVFHHLAAEHREVCELDISLMQELTGKKPVHAECMVRGGTCCRFEF